MLRSTLFLAALGLAAFDGHQPDASSALAFKEERLTVEYTVSGSGSAGEAVIVLQAEAEAGLDRIYMATPEGKSMLRLWSGEGYELALSGFVIETLEATPSDLARIYPTGSYALHARTVDGQPVQGGATLSHELLSAPQVTHPQEGSVGVPTEGLEVRWDPVPLAVGYRVVLEQGENDGLTVELPPTASEFRVPDGLLRQGADSHVEVGVIAPNGNVTLTEVAFTTL